MAQTISKHIGEGFGRGELYAALAYDATDAFGGMKIKALMLNSTGRISFLDANAYICSTATTVLDLVATTINITGSTATVFASPVTMSNATAMAITSTIVAGSTYPFSVQATLATNQSTGGFVAAYFSATLSGDTDISGSAGYRTIRSVLSITGHTSTTALSSTGCLSAIEGRYYTDNTDGITASNGIHAALAGLMKAGQYYVLSGAADYCGLAILDSTHTSATIAVTKYSGILIGGVHGGAGHTMGNAIKVGSHVTNLLEMNDDDAMAGLDGNSASAKAPDGFIRVSIGGQPCYIWTYTNIT